MESGLPKPSAELIVLGAALVEMEIALRELGLKKPHFTERILKRVRSAGMRATVIRLRPRLTTETLSAMEEAEAWVGHATVIAAAMRSGRR